MKAKAVAQELHQPVSGADAGNVRSTSEYSEAQPQPFGADAVVDSQHDLKTSAGGRGFIAQYFEKQVGRHDFARYIKETLAADFACCLAQHLSLQPQPSGADGLPDSPTRGMNLGQRIAHVGGRENAQGYIEFGSPMAVDALIQQVLRDLTASTPQGAFQARYRVPGGEWSSWGAVTCGVKGHEQELRYLATEAQPQPSSTPLIPRDEFPMLYDSLDALDERAAEQPERIAVRRHLSSLRNGIGAVMQALANARARIEVMEAKAQPSENADLTPAELSAAGCRCVRFGKGNPHWPCKLHPEQSSGNSGELDSFTAWATDYCEMHQYAPGKFSSKITEFAFMAWQARAALAARASANICNADKRQIPASQLQARGLDKDNIDAARAAEKEH